jgi:hypothetical protein
VPLTLALALLAVAVLAGILPNTGVVSATSNCTYGKCPAAAPFPLWAVGAAVLLVALALILALLLLRRRRRPPPSLPAAPTEASATVDGGGENWGQSQESPDELWSEPQGRTDSASGPEQG